MREINAPRLRDLTTLRLGGTAISLLIIEDLQELKKLPALCESLGGSPLILGHGSNILARGGDLPLVLIKLSLKPKLGVWGEQGEKILVRASAGLPMNKVLNFCLQNGLAGLEGLVGIPGSVGGLTAMNAGSFGCTVGEQIHSVLIWTENGLKLVGQSDLELAYRSFKIKNLSSDFIILETIFALTGLSKSVIFNRMNLNFFEKRSKQPVTSRSAGCVFKNPPNCLSAGKMLEEAGFRGKKLGGMAFSAKHANFLINEDNGEEDAAFDLMEMARDKVRELYGVNLEPEVRIIP